MPYVGGIMSNKEYLKVEIEHKKSLLFFTKRVIKDPPTDEVSKTMLAQADRIQAQIDELKSQLAELLKQEKSNKKQVVKRKTKRRNKR